MPNREAILTLIGVTLIKSAAGIINDWGSVSVYFLTYIHHRQPNFQIDSSTSSTFAIIVLLPTITAIVLTNKFNQKFGMRRMINICGGVYFLSGCISLLYFNMYTMIIFCLLVPVLCFSLAIVAIFHCLYSHFINDKNKVTAFAVIVFGLGAVLWNQFCTFYINPQNQKQSITDKHGQPMFFSEQIANRVPSACRIIIIGGGFIFFAGSFLITQKINPQSDSDLMQNQQNSNKLPAQHNNQENQIKNEQSFGENQNNRQNQAKSINKNYQQNHQQLQISQQQQHNQDLKSLTFIILILIALFGSVYHVYIQINLKIIYAEPIQDDHFISNGMNAIIITGFLGASLWGYCGDKYGAIHMIFLYCFVDFIIKFYTCFAFTKPTFMVAMVLLGFTDKAILTLFGPALIQVFGLYRASKLLTYKFMTLIGSIIIASGLKVVFNSIQSQVFLFLLLIFSVLNIVIGFKLREENK